ncbi:hypothetical protein [Pseudomonas sp. NPDC096950]|uniref:hypothetical protein n=1 Tax=Pseudomonas sp. NPDC096950 TaxID=3364485 RepID=UPI00383B89A4
MFHPFASEEMSGSSRALNFMVVFWSICAFFLLKKGAPHLLELFSHLGIAPTEQWAIVIEDAGRSNSSRQHDDNLGKGGHLVFKIDDPKFRAMASLGVPGLTVGLIFAVIGWVKPETLVIPAAWGGPIAMVIVLVAGLICFRVTTPRPAPVTGPVSISIPHPMRFQQVAEIVAGEAVVQFLGFNQAELDYLVQPRQFTGINTASLLTRIGDANRTGIRLYSVNASTTGLIVLTIH